MTGANKHPASSPAEKMPRTEKSIEDVLAAIAAFTLEVNKRFDEVNERFDKLSTEFSALKAENTQLREELDGLKGDRYMNDYQQAVLFYQQVQEAARTRTHCVRVYKTPIEEALKGEEEAKKAALKFFQCNRGFEFVKGDDFESAYRAFSTKDKPIVIKF